MADASRVLVARAVDVTASQEVACAAAVSNPRANERDLARVQPNDAVAAPADTIARARALVASQDEARESKLNEARAASLTLVAIHEKLVEAARRAARERALALALIQV
jgi:hypothetical protein